MKKKREKEEKSEQLGKGFEKSESETIRASRIKLIERDFVIFREISRWRFCLGRHIRALCNFSGERSCDRRLKVLIEAGFLERKKIIYGIPSIYFLTGKARLLLGMRNRPDKFRIEQISHDIAVIDTAIYIIAQYGIKSTGIVTEKELHSCDGFTTRKHQPDFIFTFDGEIYAVEVELSLKSINRFKINVENNFTSYDYQIWIVPKQEYKIKKLLEGFSEIYPNIKIIPLEEIQNNDKSTDNNRNQ